MTPEERATLDPQKVHHRHPAFAVAFPRGCEPLTNRRVDFSRLERFVPRFSLADAVESDDAYIARAVKAGCLIAVTSAEVKADPRVLRRRLTEAYDHNVPLMKVTDQTSEPPELQYGTPERDAAKLAALATARRIS